MSFEKNCVYQGVKSLEKEMPTHARILAWEIPWTEEHGGLQSMGLQRVGRDLVTKQTNKSPIPISLTQLLQYWEIPHVYTLFYTVTLMTPWTAGHQAPLSMDFSRQEYWSGLPLPSRGDLPDPGIEHRSPTLQADSLPTEPPWRCLLSWVPHNFVDFFSEFTLYLHFPPVLPHMFKKYSIALMVPMLFHGEDVSQSTLPFPWLLGS